MRQVTETSLDESCSSVARQASAGRARVHARPPAPLLPPGLQRGRLRAHRGVIHCDIKPANILLGEYGEVLLVDWGLAQSQQPPARRRGGTLGYMAPEQMDARRSTFDERTDVFALGAILYEILCRQPAFADAGAADVTTSARIRSSATAAASAPSEPRRTPASRARSRTSACTRSRSIATERSRARERRGRDRRVDRGHASETRAPAHRGRQERRCRRRARRALSRVRRVAPREAARVPRAARRRRAVGARPTTSRTCGTSRTSCARSPTRCRCARSSPAVCAYERALDAVPEHEGARRGLARLYWLELAARAGASGTSTIACGSRRSRRLRRRRRRGDRRGPAHDRGRARRVHARAVLARRAISGGSSRARPACSTGGRA